MLKIEYCNLQNFQVPFRCYAKDSLCTYNWLKLTVTPIDLKHVHFQEAQLENLQDQMMGSHDNRDELY